MMKTNINTSIKNKNPKKAKRNSYSSPLCGIFHQANFDTCVSRLQLIDAMRFRLYDDCRIHFSQFIFEIIK